MSTRKVTLALTFYAEAPDDDGKGDEWADNVGDAAAATLRAAAPRTVYAESIEVSDWTDVPESLDE